MEISHERQIHFGAHQIPMQWRYEACRQYRQSCCVQIPTSARILLAAVDRSFTKAGCSVYDELNGLRVYTGFARIRIRNAEHDYEINSEVAIPRLWLFFLGVLVASTLLSGNALWGTTGIAASVFIYKLMRGYSCAKATAQVEEFKEKLADIIRAETGAIVHLHSAERN